MSDATHLLKNTALDIMDDQAPVIRCALDEKKSASSDLGSSATSVVSDPPFIAEGSKQVCCDPPIWVFDDLLSDSLLRRVDDSFEGIRWQPMNGRQVRMVELSIDEQLAELTETLRSISHIEDVAPCGKAWIMDVIGRNQGPHLDGWEVEKNAHMQLLDLSRCSVQCHKGFSTIIPTLSFVVYFNDAGGIAFPQAALPNPTIPAKRGRILMFQNYDDAQRPAHNPRAVHYGIYGDFPKRVMTAGVMSSSTPSELSGSSPAGASKTKGFLYAPIMHRSNTSCGIITPPTPPPPPKPKPKPVLQLLVRHSHTGGFIVEAHTLAGNMMAKALIEKDATLGSLRAALAVDAQLVCKDEVLDGPDKLPIADTVLVRGMEHTKPYDPRLASGLEPASTSSAQTKDDHAHIETLVEWDVIDTMFVKKEDSVNTTRIRPLVRPPSAAGTAAADQGTDANDIDELHEELDKLLEDLKDI